MRGNCACIGKRKQEMEGVKTQKGQARYSRYGMREGVAEKNIIEMEMRARQCYVELCRKSKGRGQERICDKKEIRLGTKVGERVRWSFRVRIREWE